MYVIIVYNAMLVPLSDANKDF